MLNLCLVPLRCKHQVLVFIQLMFYVYSHKCFSSIRRLFFCSFSVYFPPAPLQWWHRILYTLSCSQCIPSSVVHQQFISSFFVKPLPFTGTIQVTWVYSSWYLHLEIHYNVTFVVWKWPCVFSLYGIQNYSYPLII